MKIRIKHTKFYGQTITLPIVGATKIGTDGIVDIDENAAKLLLDNVNWENLPEEAPKTSSKSSSKKETPVSEVSPEELVIDEQLNGMNLEQLIAFANESKLLEEKKLAAFSKNEKILRSSLKAKMLEQVLDKETGK